MAIIPLEFSLLTWVFDSPIVGKQAACTCGVATPTSEWDSSDLAAARDAWGDTLLVLQSAAWKLAKVVAYEGATGGVLTHELLVNEPGDNTESSASVPQVAVLIRKVTGAAGRANRGRMFVPGALESSMLPNGELDTTPHAAWQSAATALFTALGAMGAQPFLLHSPPKVGSTPPPTAITSFSVDATSATQRRRIR